MRWFVIMLLCLPTASAWNWDTHQALVDVVYYSLQEDARRKLDLNLMEEGSIIPDRDFRDFVRHSFPRSLERTSYWLEQTQIHFEKGDYNNASLAFGIASHYLTDTFSSPHSVSGEAYELHKRYEDQGSASYRYIDCLDQKVDVGDVLYTGSKEGESWGRWVDTRDEQLPQRAAHDAGMYLLAAGILTFNSSCTTFGTLYEEQSPSWKISSIVFGAMVALILAGAGISLYRGLKHH